MFALIYLGKRKMKLKLDVFSFSPLLGVINFFCHVWTYQTWRTKYFLIPKTFYLANQTPAYHLISGKIIIYSPKVTNYDNCCCSHYDFNFVTFTVVLFTNLGQNTCMHLTCKGVLMFMCPIPLNKLEEC